MTTPNRGFEDQVENTLQPGAAHNQLAGISDRRYGVLSLALTTDADRTLLQAETDYATLVIGDPDTVLTGGIDVVFPAKFPLQLVVNGTAQTLTLKKTGETGVAVAAGTSVMIACGESDVLAAGGSSGVSTLDALTDVDITGRADGDHLSWDATAGKWVPVTPGGGGGGGGMTLLGIVTAGGGGAASLTVSGIPTGYTALKIVYHGRGTKAATYDELRLNFNGDTGANYNYQLASFTGTGPGFSEVRNAGYAEMGYASAASAPANSPAAVEMMVPDYLGTTFDKTGIATYALDIGTTSAGIRTIFWHPSTPAAITSVSVSMPGGDHVAGSKLMVYGLP